MGKSLHLLLAMTLVLGSFAFLHARGGEGERGGAPHYGGAPRYGDAYHPQYNRGGRQLNRDAAYNAAYRGGGYYGPENLYWEGNGGPVDPFYDEQQSQETYQNYQNE